MRDSGCGLDVDYTGYGREIGRIGNDFGSQIQIEHFPDSKSTIVLLMNTGNTGNPGTVFRRLRDAALNAALGDIRSAGREDPAALYCDRETCFKRRMYQWYID